MPARVENSPGCDATPCRFEGPSQSFLGDLDQSLRSATTTTLGQPALWITERIQIISRLGRVIEFLEANQLPSFESELDKNSAGDHILTVYGLHGFLSMQNHLVPTRVKRRLKQQLVGSHEGLEILTVTV